MSGFSEWLFSKGQIDFGNALVGLATIIIAIASLYVSSRGNRISRSVRSETNAMQDKNEISSLVSDAYASFSNHVLHMYLNKDLPIEKRFADTKADFRELTRTFSQLRLRLRPTIPLEKEMIDKLNDWQSGINIDALYDNIDEEMNDFLDLAQKIISQRYQYFLESA